MFFIAIVLLKKTNLSTRSVHKREFKNRDEGRKKIQKIEFNRENNKKAQ